MFDVPMTAGSEKTVTLQPADQRQVIGEIKRRADLIGVSDAVSRNEVCTLKSEGPPTVAVAASEDPPRCDEATTRNRQKQSRADLKDRHPFGDPHVARRSFP